MSVIELPDEPKTDPETAHELGDHDASIEQLQTDVAELKETIAHTTEIIGDHTANHPEPIAVPLDVVDHSLYVTKEELIELEERLKAEIVVPAPVVEPENKPDSKPKSREKKSSSSVRDWFYK